MAQVIVNRGPGVDAYVQTEGHKTCLRPERCPLCGAVGSLRGHGYYPRKPKGLGRDVKLWIKRWRCKVCRRTTSCLPCFVLPFRHYVLVFIQWVLVTRYTLARSWAGVMSHCAGGEGLHVRTVRRWCKSFATQASTWLAAVQTTLAQQDSASAWLDAQGEALHAPTAAQALLTATEHWLAWAQTQWVELAPYGLANRLCAVWLWGATRGLPRLA